VVVRQDVAVGADDDAGAEALLPLRARLLLLLFARQTVAEQLAQRRVVHERRLLCLHATLRADCDDRRRDAAHDARVGSLHGQTGRGRDGLPDCVLRETVLSAEGDERESDEK